MLERYTFCGLGFVEEVVGALGRGCKDYELGFARYYHLGCESRNPSNLSIVVGWVSGQSMCEFLVSGVEDPRVFLEVADGGGYACSANGVGQYHNLVSLPPLDLVNGWRRAQVPVVDQVWTGDWRYVEVRNHLNEPVAATKLSAHSVPRGFTVITGN